MKLNLHPHLQNPTNGITLHPESQKESLRTVSNPVPIWPGHQSYLPVLPPKGSRIPSSSLLCQNRLRPLLGTTKLPEGLLQPGNSPKKHLLKVKKKTSTRTESLTS